MKKNSSQVVFEQLKHKKILINTKSIQQRHYLNVKRAFSFLTQCDVGTELFLLSSAINDFDLDSFFNQYDFNFVMGEKYNIKNDKDSQEQSPLQILLGINKATLQERVTRKSKKDNLRDKKKSKNQVIGEINIANHQNQSFLLQIGQADRQLAFIKGLTQGPRKIVQDISRAKFPYPLEKMLRKPTYVSILNLNTISGSFGHSTAYFRRPVLQGVFYMDYIFKEDQMKDSQATFQSSVRLGLCAYNFNHSFPLGWNESIGYQSSDGNIVYRGQIIHKGQPYKVGDVIRVFLKMSPPYKHSDSSKVSENSSVSFLKNDTLIYCFKELKQTFYCFASSVYNYSQVEVVGKSTNNLVYTAGQHYFDCLKEVIPYKDLQSSNIFKF